ncbi:MULTISPECIES: type VI secretion system baseplate subunit TssE [Moraxella]|uniref:GPW/gp25 family protein n=2 Tax=Moraxella TaxID=475 RepID=A0A1S9ZZG8_MORBO|nr:MULTISPECIES: GPW/gp25 family protein [Moraxella]AWY19336.1 type VI secretion system baseplate subunit TssE [Moraxella bovis]OOR88905.1 hypothetical protein B0182_08365 [Moraxella bovis]OPH33746.1 hypothetical protein B5J93_12590 [Moraxella equi]UYZ68236.1 GPW/gp25 family protein [Moraxella bovis]UYZ70618.1 GPW/gp25 family protein [Moraxella bovis]
MANNTASIYDRLMQHTSGASISHSQLREFVIRDLLSLLNTASYYTDNHAYFSQNETYHCVMNYGIHPLSGKRASEINWLDVESNITASIRAFESRILPESLEVKCLTKHADDILHNQVSIQITGLIRSSPHPERFVLTTKLDLETGSFNPT